MKTISYYRINNIIGIVIFLIAATVYCLTVEPSASFWDCGEFIVSAYKLEVGHPPGAPFFMLTANVFTQLTNDPALAARMVNYMSALLSAATIWLLYLSITHLVRKLISGNNIPQRPAQVITVVTSGIVGALAYTFSDTFWFSAVEGEVYAYSSLFTALVFWLILKWEDEKDEAYADRWLILIAYLIGLSIGVHLLNLLCLPAIVLVHYYKNNPDATVWGSLRALIVSAVLIIAILYGIVPGIVKVGGWFELLFVNRFGLPFHSGLVFYLVALAATIVWGICASYKKNQRMARISILIMIGLLGIPFFGNGATSIIFGIIVLAAGAFYLFSKAIKHKYKPSPRQLNTSILCVMMLLIGYSSYALIMIRSAANTPMDQNSPEDIFSLGYFLGREQYGQRPLIYGQSFLSESNIVQENGVWKYDFRKGKPMYKQKAKESEGEKDSYIIAANNWEKIYAHNMLFPRMWNPDFAESYKQWTNLKGKEVDYNRAGEHVVTVTVPTQWENISFLISYQLNFMYWRYFMWNFVGRQNDIQGNGEPEHGNWITGIPFIDNILEGDQKLLPAELKENKGRNVYYGLPLILGILGIVWQLRRGKQGQLSFSIVFMLFFMTGIAIIMYLNQTPLQVRERDYAYAGSFYAFTIWIGMGVAEIAHLLKKRMHELPASIVASVVCITIPIQMASQTWDDHDRSGRYACRDFGSNYLTSAPEGNHPVVFTMGDNDTFPLWYNQEVEGFRTDIRTCNAAYIQSDWYIDQMKRDYYDSPALPIPWERREYLTSETEVFMVQPELKQQIDNLYRMAPEEARKEFGDNPYEAKNILKYWIRSDEPGMRRIPTDSLVIKIDKEAVLRSGMMIPEELNGEIPEYMHLSLKGRSHVTRAELMMLEIVSGCNWERPVYIAASVGADGQFCFKDNLCQEGLLCRITPFNTTALNARIDSERTYDCLMNRFQWGGIENPDVYMDETSRRLYIAARMYFVQLAGQLIAEGKTDKALNALDHCRAVIPHESLPYDNNTISTRMAEYYYALGEFEKADEIMDYLTKTSREYVNWYLSMSGMKWYNVASQCMYHLYMLHEENKIMEKYGSNLLDESIEEFEVLYDEVNRRHPE